MNPFLSQLDALSPLFFLHTPIYILQYYFLERQFEEESLCEMYLCENITTYCIL